VVSRAVTFPSIISITYTPMVPSKIMEAWVRTRLITLGVRIRASRLRGGLVITAGSTGSTPRD